MLGRVAAVLLASCWIVLGGAKLDAWLAVSPGLSAPTAWETGLAVAAGVFELALGVLVLLGTAPWRRRVLVASIVWLVLLGSLATLQVTKGCECGGRLFRMDKGIRLLVVSGMLAIAIVAWLQDGRLVSSTMRARLRDSFAAILIAGCAIGALASRGRPDSVRPVSTTGQLEATRPPTELAAAPRVTHPAAAAQETSTVAFATDSVHGIVVNSVDGAPLVGARVWADRWSASGHSADRAVVRSDRNGLFRISIEDSSQGVDGGARAWRLHALAEGYRPSAVSRPSEPAASDGIRIALEPGASLDGSVVDESGAAVEGAVVRAWGILGDEIEESAPDARPPYRVSEPPDGGWATTGTDGRFRIGGLVSGSAYRVIASHESYANPVGLSSPEFAVPGQLVMIRMRSLFGARLRAVDAETREPISDAYVSWRVERDFDMNVDISPFAWLEDIQPRDSIAPRIGGSYRLLTALKTPSPLTIEVVARASGYVEVRERVPLTRWPNTLRDIKLVRTRHEPLRDIGFVAKFEGGRPFTGALVLIINSTGGRCILAPFVEFRDGIGTRRVALGVADRVIRIGAGGRGKGTGNWMVAAEEREIDVSGLDVVPLELRGGCVRVTARGPSGDVYRGYTLSIDGGHVTAVPETWKSEHDEPGWIGEDGSIVVWLEPGAQRIGVRKRGFRPAYQQVRVPSTGDVVEAEFNLAKD